MKYRVIPILDRRIVTLQDKFNPFFTIDVDEQHINDYIYNVFSITFNDYNILIGEDGNNYIVGYCVDITKKIEVDLLREDSHLGKLPPLIQNYINNLIKNDKKQQRFTFTDDHKDLVVIQTFTCINIQNTDLICLVRDGGEEHFTFPGGTCEIYESDVEGAMREVKEEAQIECKELHFLGGNVVDIVRPSGEIVQSFFQSRFFTQIKIENVSTFIPFCDGFETEERIFVKAQELNQYIPRLHYAHGIPIYKQIMNLL